MRHLARSLLLAFTASALVPAPASGGATNVIHVHPGPRAISRAVDRAGPGDTIKIHHGRYHERVVVDVRGLRLVAAGDGPVTIDHRCGQGLEAVDVVANGVTLKGLRVVGGRTYDVDASFVNNVSLRDLFLRSTCEGAEYGINVYWAGRVVVRRSEAIGFLDAGIYVGRITSGSVTVVDNFTHGNNVGILLEDSLPDTIVARDNRANENDLAGFTTESGILVRRSDGLLVRDNRARRNGEYGIWVDSQSDDNDLPGNSMFNNGTLDGNDEGASNCWYDSNYATSDPDPLPACG
jgi:parallel beta-helix repeat protein